MRIISKVIAVVTFPVMLAGCSGFVQDFKNLEAMAKSPNVVYADPDQFACEVKPGTTTRGQVVDCGVCMNRSGIVRVVTINGVAGQVQPGQRVIRCSDNARIMAMESAPWGPAPFVQEEFIGGPFATAEAGISAH